jgi:hypothetical protein
MENLSKRKITDLIFGANMPSSSGVNEFGSSW